ncbi:MAG: 30S ribosomal protein S5 [Planctomycetia bacterium TMED53]|nr:MAG: 30S ribosomal protein S5 [Planctomycetia bacterium TMED53]
MSEEENKPAENPETPAAETPAEQNKGAAAEKPEAAASENTEGGRGGRGGNNRQGGGRGGRGGRGGGRGRGRGRGREEDEGPRLEERVVKINRVAATVKGGRRMSFSALVVLGDKKGKVGIGFGKAKEVQSALEKAFKDARANLVTIELKGTTIPHEVVGVSGTAKIKLIPASPGTGVIAGASGRAVLECLGVQDVLTKQYGSNNPLNVVKATLEGLGRMRSREQVAKLRGVNLV